MLVSVIIPSYNSRKFLHETINCILNQTYKNIEIIIIDDGSTDGSYEYLKSLKHPKLTVVKNKSKGACSARNLGIEMAKGDYIQFLDADDLLSPEKIFIQLNTLLECANKNSIASCKWVHFTKNIEDAEHKPLQKVDKSYDEPINWLLDSWNGGGMGQTAIWLIPKALIDKVGKWDEELLKNQDGEYMCRILCHSSEIIFSEHATVFYRKPSKGNVSQNTTKKGIKSLLDSYKKYEYILKFNTSLQVRKSLSANYCRFIYIYYNNHKELAKEAIKQIEKLGIKVDIPFSNPLFRYLSLFMGYKSAFQIRKILKGY